MQRVELSRPLYVPEIYILKLNHVVIVLQPQEIIIILCKKYIFIIFYNKCSSKVSVFLFF